MGKKIQKILLIGVIKTIKIFNPPSKAGWKKSKRKNNLKGR